MTESNFMINRGFGKWQFWLYNYGIGGDKVTKEMTGIGPLEGMLEASKDWHDVKSSSGKVLVHVPSQNVAYVVNMLDEEDEE